eukprot:9215235-Karenia_brevis.AAC.1
MTASGLEQGRPRFAINKAKLSDPVCCDSFQCELWNVVASTKEIEFHDVDEHLEAINTAVRKAASTCFGGPKDQPNKKWISWDTW